MLSDVTGNYPPGTWDADPRAPWNEPEPWEGRTCGECAHCGRIVGSAGRDTRVCCEDLGDVEEVDPGEPACDRFE